MNQPALAQTPNFISDLTSGRVELPTIPRVVQRLIAALRNPDVDARTISAELSQDPVLCAKVLRLANSSFFGGQRSVSSIDSAIALVGSQAINKLIVACGVSSAFGEVPGINLRAFWSDALLVATAANKLAPRLEADPEAAYISGLLHATGHLILCQAYPAVADGIFTGYAAVRGAKLAAIEKEAFGIDHPTVGALWVESLGFPQIVVDTIKRAAFPPADTDSPLDLAVRGGSRLAFASSRKVDSDVALAALQPSVRMRFTDKTGKPNTDFVGFYEGLCGIEPTF